MASILNLVLSPGTVLRKEGFNKTITRHEGTHPILILNDVLANAGQGGPLAVVDGLDCTSFMHLTLAHFAAQSMRCHTCGSHTKGRFCHHIYSETMAHKFQISWFTGYYNKRRSFSINCEHRIIIVCD
jgi:hypothetical protein